MTQSKHYWTHRATRNEIIRDLHENGMSKARITRWSGLSIDSVRRIVDDGRDPEAYGDTAHIGPGRR